MSRVIPNAVSRGGWQPDGWDATVRIGLLVPYADVGRSRSCGRSRRLGWAFTPRGCRSERWRRAA